MTRRRFLTHFCLCPLLPAALLTASLPPSAAHAAAAREWPRYAPDESGAGVRAIQLLLRAHGLPVAVDGTYGGRTAMAVKAFQRAHHLVVSGVTNEATWEALVVKVQPGSRGDAVQALQACLRDAGYAVPLDGVFGPQTRQAVQKFQARKGLAADGIVGPYTWSEIIPVSDGPGSD